MIVHICTWVNQLLSQFLMKQFDTLLTQCRHIEHMHEGVWFKKILLTIFLDCLKKVLCFKHVLVSCKNEEDPIKNQGAKSVHNISPIVSL